ncbi:MAG: inositol monophosphatase [Caldisericaceae bacterium]
MFEYDFVIDLANSVGKIIKENFRKTLDIELKSKRDLVTNVDKFIDNFVREKIIKEYPSYGIITEENVDVNSNSNKKFIIDPLDGTHNFVKSFPFVAVSIAYMEDETLKFGVVYNPILDEFFVGEFGKGAMLNGKSISVSKTKTLEDALIATGFVYAARNEKTFSTFREVLDSALSIRCNGSAALDLAYVAQGVFDGYYQKGIHIWDIAAGSLIVKEAGGYVTDFIGNENFLNKNEVFATNKLIHRDLLKMVGSF